MKTTHGKPSKNHSSVRSVNGAKKNGMGIIMAGIMEKSLKDYNEIINEIEKSGAFIKMSKYGIIEAVRPEEKDSSAGSKSSDFFDFNNLTAENSEVEIVARIIPGNIPPAITFCEVENRYKFTGQNFEDIDQDKDAQKLEYEGFRRIREKMLMINLSMRLLRKITESAVSKQVKFIISGNCDDLVVLEEKEIAAILGVDVSWISRIIKGRSAVRCILVEDRVVSLRSLFVSCKEYHKIQGKKLVGLILQKAREKGRRHYSDEDVKRILTSKYGFCTSRRTINNWRREMEMSELSDVQESSSENIDETRSGSSLFLSRN